MESPYSISMAQNDSSATQNPEVGEKAIVESSSFTGTRDGDAKRSSRSFIMDAEQKNLNRNNASEGINVPVDGKSQLASDSGSAMSLQPFLHDSWPHRQPDVTIAPESNPSQASTASQNSVTSSNQSSRNTMRRRRLILPHMDNPFDLDTPVGHADSSEAGKGHHSSDNDSLPDTQDQGIGTQYTQPGFPKFSNPDDIGAKYNARHGVTPSSGEASQGTPSPLHIHYMRTDFTVNDDAVSDTQINTPLIGENSLYELDHNSFPQTQNVWITEGSMTGVLPPSFLAAPVQGQSDVDIPDTYVPRHDQAASASLESMRVPISRSDNRYIQAPNAEQNSAATDISADDIPDTFYITPSPSASKPTYHTKSRNDGDKTQTISPPNSTPVSDDDIPDTQMFDTVPPILGKPHFVNLPSSPSPIPSQGINHIAHDNKTLLHDSSFAPAQDISFVKSPFRQLSLNKLSVRERKRLVVSPYRPSSLTESMRQWIIKTHRLLDPFREDDDCWFHPNPPPGRLSVTGIARACGKIQKLFTWQDKSGKHSLVINYGIVSKLVNYKMNKQQKDGFINKQWHLSHLCGNWTCINPEHTTVEPGTINISRNNCFSHRSGCLHNPLCMKDKKVALDADGKPIDYSKSNCAHGATTQAAIESMDDWSSQVFNGDEDSYMADEETDAEPNSTFIELD